MPLGLEHTWSYWCNGNVLVVVVVVALFVFNSMAKSVILLSFNIYQSELLLVSL